MSLTSLLNSSKSSDSTKKRYTKRLYKTLKNKHIVDKDITEDANKYKEFYEVIKGIPIVKGNDDITEKLFISFLQNHIKTRKDTEIPEKYRYPLRDDLKYKYVLRKEIPIAKLNNNLCGNTSPGVFELLKDNPMIPMDWSLLAKHPDAFLNEDELIKKISELKHKNTAFCDRFWSSLCENTNPMVINYIKEKILKEKENKDKTFKRRHYNILAKNPTPVAIQLVEERIKENNISIRKNPSVYGEPNAENSEFYIILSTNPSKEAFTLLSTSLKGYFSNFEDINMNTIWRNLFANSSAINFILKNYNGWGILNNDHKNIQNNLQKNPNSKAIPLLEEKKGPIKYNYNYLSENPSSRAIKLLKKRMDEEKRLTEIDYNALISDRLKSGLINWEKVSKNPRAKSLILAKIKEEEGMETVIDEYNKSKGYDKIYLDYEKYLNWDYVSANPAIFTRTKVLQPALEGTPI
jgi:hypothetical protein